jgi:hypothetical protein
MKNRFTPRQQALGRIKLISNYCGLLAGDHAYADEYRAALDELGSANLTVTQLVVVLRLLEAALLMLIPTTGTETDQEHYQQIANCARQATETRHQVKKNSEKSS